MTDVKVVLYKCGLCEGLHPWGWDGDCREDRNRYSDELDYCERHSGKVIEIEVRSWEERQAADVRALATPFSPEVLALLTVPELTVLQHDLRRFPEDAVHLAVVLQEIRRRALGGDR